jgi:hypothetical protein
MPNLNQFPDKTLIAMIRSDSLRQAQASGRKLDEVIESLGDENHLGALGALLGLDQEIVTLKVFLSRIAKLTVGESTELDA